MNTLNTACTITVPYPGSADERVQNYCGGRGCSQFQPFVVDMRLAQFNMINYCYYRVSNAKIYFLQINSFLSDVCWEVLA